MNAVSATDIAAGTSCVLIDIRPEGERRSELGWLPASIRIPDASPTAQVEWAQAQATSSETLVFYCASGRRSEEFVEAFPSPRSVMHLDGGVLAWRAAGLPTCGVEQVQTPTYLDSVASMSDFRRALQACFVSQMSVVADDADPMAVLRECLDAEGVSWDNLETRDMPRLVDRMALMSRRNGTDWATIVENTNIMMSALAQVERDVSEGQTPTKRPILRIKPKS